MPEYFPYNTLSPVFKLILISFPDSFILPGPAWTIVPICGFSLAVSGKIIPEAVVSSTSSAWTIILSDKENIKKRTSQIFDEINRYFRPEFLNRIDDIVIFNSLEKEHLYKIIDLQLNDLKINLLKKNNSLRFTKKVKDFLLKDGSHRDWGARPIRRIIQNEIENLISTKFLLNEFTNDGIISIKVENDKLHFIQFPKKKKSIKTKRDDKAAKMA